MSSFSSSSSACVNGSSRRKRREEALLHTLREAAAYVDVPIHASTLCSSYFTVKSTLAAARTWLLCLLKAPTGRMKVLQEGMPMIDLEPLKLYELVPCRYHFLHITLMITDIPTKSMQSATTKNYEGRLSSSDVHAYRSCMQSVITQNNGSTSLSSASQYALASRLPSFPGGRDIIRNDSCSQQTIEPESSFLNIEMPYVQTTHLQSK